MSVAELLSSYGYFAVLLGTFLEGETILIMAGFAAHRGYLNIAWVIGLATLGSFIGDQLYFYLGKRHGWAILDRFPSVKPRARKVQALLDRYHLPLIIGIRFMYGLRIAGPLAIGMSTVHWSRFFILNLIGAILWATLVGGAGYVFGETLQLMLSDIKHYEEALLALMAAAGIAFWLRYRVKHKNDSD
jgi:membrane protein DedA with SNARE-associated domain